MFTLVPLGPSIRSLSLDLLEHIFSSKRYRIIFQQHIFTISNFLYYMDDLILSKNNQRSYWI
ncbi:hypothetical protein BpHYR1_003339 [Brachionus plicatilis]|uniref:Uncharacterized protein n=1 Tax=Brachionus plicatilis TaxID=10195 RepID=A0A3M7R961_BRAPC|nr:hypothetical protein BpHYR1_003339 [Brachionus plicatilis]